MREIKFRAWGYDRHHILLPMEERIDLKTSSGAYKGKWIMGEVMTYHQKKNKVRMRTGRGFSLSMDIEIGEHCILMQYTGLLDKNGKEIYEGDVIKYCYNLGMKSSETEFTGVVEYHDKVLEVGYEHDQTRFVGFILRGYCPVSKEDWFTSIPDIKDIKIIGNIYENPELIK